MGPTVPTALGTPAPLLLDQKDLAGALLGPARF